MSYSFEELCEDWKGEGRMISSCDYDRCEGCNNQVKVDELTEESICTECKPDFYCKICGAYDETIKFCGEGICELCEEEIEALKEQPAKDIGQDMAVLAAGVVTFLIIVFSLFIGNADAAQVNMDAIKHIESSGNPAAWNKRDDSRGLYQLREVVVKEWNNYHPHEQHTFEDVWNPQINEKIATWYMTKRIPQMLRYYKIDDTKEHCIIAYNWGIGNLTKWVRSGSESNRLPHVTKKYLMKYAEINR